MQNVALAWDQAGVLAGALYVGSYALNRAPSSRVHQLWPAMREAGTIAALYALWQLVGSLSVLGTQGAYARDRWIVRAERDWHLPTEADVQSWILPHPLISQLCNLYYAGMHFTSLFAVLLWVFFRHRDQHPRTRASVIVITAVCLAIQFLPVAPPRLVPRSGVVDLAERYGQSVYSAAGAGADQLGAMPSVHVAWSVLVAVVVIRVSASRWRWLVLAHPVLTVFVVVATGNHFWLDGIVAVALLVISEVMLSVLARMRAARQFAADRDTPSAYALA